MKQEVCVLPVRCRGCGAVFDLWYDLQEMESAIERENALSRKTIETHCWRCRQAKVEQMQEEELYSDEIAEDVRLSAAYEID